MFRRFSVNFAVTSIFLDFLFIDFALWVSSELRTSLSFLSFVKEIPAPVHLPIDLYLFFPPIWIGVFLLFAVYDGRKNLRIVDELSSLSLGSLLAGVALAGILYFSYRDVSRFLFLFFFLLAYGLLLLWRFYFRTMFRYAHEKGMRERRVLILGAGDVGRLVVDQIRAHPYLGLKLVGFLDDDPDKLSDLKDVLGSLDQAHQIAIEKRIDDVIITLPMSAHERLTQVVSELHDLPVRVRVVPDYFSLTLHRASVEEFAGIPMLDLRAPALNDYQRMIKRAFDLIVTLVGLPFALPVMAIIAMAIRFDSHGPIFYLAGRVGENSKPFKMFKFRTMVQDADKMKPIAAQTITEQVVLKRADDPRITRVGHFLRKTSLDELPQLLNVLRGDMSLVGPRPELPALVKQYASWQRKRFVVPQGMTGWWQVNGRSDKPMHLHTDEDLYYVQHYSIWLDIQILARTIWTVLRGRGAY